MLTNWLKITLRHFARHRSYTFITVFGLSLGLACCFLVLLLWQYEQSYDTFQQKADRVYRINYGVHFQNSNLTLARIPPPLAPQLPQFFSEIEATARLFPRSLPVTIFRETGGEVLKKLEIQNAYFADPEIFKMLTFDVLQGNRQNPLDEPYSVVITDEIANNLFGRTDVVGKTIHFVNEFPFKITAVIKKYPDNSHIQFDLLAPYQNIVDVEPENLRETVEDVLENNWIASHSAAYVLLKPGHSAKNINARFPEFLTKFAPPQHRNDQVFTLQPLRELHFNSDIQLEPTATADQRSMRLFMGIGFITLIIACINFINLATALSFSRAGEVGIRKVLGAGRRGLVQHFFGETALLSVLSFLLALAIVYLALPTFNELVARQIPSANIWQWQNLLIFSTVLILTILLAGWYPSLFVTRYKPVDTLKARGVVASSKGSWLRQSLITIQFAASVALIAGTMIVYQQLQFLRTQELGFRQDAMITIPLFSADLHNAFGGVDGSMRQRMEAFEQEIAKNPRIQGSTVSSGALGLGAVQRPVWSEKVSQDKNIFASDLAVDYDFLPTYELELVAGRGFDRAFGTDHLNAFVLNESAVKLLGWNTPEEALGGRVMQPGKEGVVIGVVKDFNYQSLRTPIDALIMNVNVPTFTTFTIKLQPQDISQTLQFVEREWNKIFPERTFSYNFLDETIAQTFDNEANFGKTISYFAFLAILISCFGLFGLTTHAIQQKTKEIGVRKVLGASVAHIVGLLAKDFMKLVLVALLIAIPVAWYFMDGWLQDFAYRIRIQWWVFVAAGVLALVIAFVTVSFQSIRAALTNPVKSLRSE
ncbi:MAG: FtsX-like permease family protein [Saprospiraceae bacterium]